MAGRPAGPPARGRRLVLRRSGRAGPRRSGRGPPGPVRPGTLGQGPDGPGPGLRRDARASPGPGRPRAPGRGVPASQGDRRGRIDERLLFAATALAGRDGGAGGGVGGFRPWPGGAGVARRRRAGGPPAHPGRAERRPCGPRALNVLKAVRSYFLVTLMFRSATCPWSPWNMSGPSAISLPVSPPGVGPLHSTFSWITASLKVTLRNFAFETFFVPSNFGAWNSMTNFCHSPGFRVALVRGAA